MLEWTPEEASLLQDRPSLLQRQSTSQGNMGDSEPPDILYETCACIIHTINLQLHVHYNRPIPYKGCSVRTGLKHNWVLTSH